MKILGIAIGVLGAMIVLEGRSRNSPAPDGPMMSESSGTLREIVIHYVAGDSIALPVYRSFLPQLAADVTVNVLCPDAAAFDELRGSVGTIFCTLKPLMVGHPITVWSRDRWIALDPVDESSPTILLAPREEAGSEMWPTRAGDSQAAADIARLLPGDAVARRLGLEFDGGDLLADDERVFVTPAVLRRNLHRAVESPEQLVKMLASALGKPVVLLDESPDHHAGMFMMSAGDRTMLVGDPSLGRGLMSGNMPSLPGGPDFTPQTQHQFDAVAAQLLSLGYRVIRIPTLVAPDAKTYLTYVNAIIDHRDGKSIVYMPTYKGADSLNAAAAVCWREAGYEVRPVDCTTSYPWFGNLHCLVNVLSKAR